MAHRLRPFRRRQCSARTPTRPDGATIQSTDPDTRHDDHSIDTLAHDNNKHSKRTLHAVSLIPMLALHERARLSARPLRAGRTRERRRARRRRHR
eukprot:2549194-Prymnesium_polylepis.1